MMNHCFDGILLRFLSFFTVTPWCVGMGPMAGHRATTDIRTRGRCAMGERSLRGSRLGSVSYETERNTAPIERQYAEYRCPSGHLFTVPFADDAELPDTWECKFDGGAAKLVGGAEPAPKKVKPPRTHWDMLLERRSVEDLEEVLAERLDVLRGRRTRAS